MKQFELHKIHIRSGLITIPQVKALMNTLNKKEQYRDEVNELLRVYRPALKDRDMFSTHQWLMSKKFGAHETRPLKDNPYTELTWQVLKDADCIQLNSLIQPEPGYIYPVFTVYHGGHIGFHYHVIGDTVHINDAALKVQANLSTKPYYQSLSNFKQTKES